MPHTHRRTAALLVVSVSALASCTPTPGTPTPPPTAAAPMPGLTDTEWRCIELFDANGVPLDTTRNPPTLRIARDGRASGFAGVNRYGCDASIGNSISLRMRLAFGPVMTTRMAGPPERMALEQAFTAMLGTVRESDVSIGADGATTLVLRNERGVCAHFAAGSGQTSALERGKREGTP